MASYDRHARVDTRALDDPTHARHIGHHPNIWRTSVENEFFVGVIEYVGRSLAKNSSSQCVHCCHMSFWFASLCCCQLWS
eukprot:9483203-Pyramimonas_sp.AAC.1